MPEYIYIYMYIYNVGFQYASFCHFDVGNFITHHVQAPPPGRPHSVASPLPGSQAVKYIDIAIDIAVCIYI